MTPRARKNWGSRFVIALSLATVAAAGFLAWGSYELLRAEFPDVSILKKQFPVVQYDPSAEEGERATVRFSKVRPAAWVDLGGVSKAAVGAILVSEDWAFYSHKGYDANQIREAIKEDWEEGRFARGASTITQQVAKNVFLERDKNLWRKLKELYLALRLEEKVGKRRILETYLNVAEWGEGIYGIQRAARHYFDKSPAELTAKEGAFLAMLLPSPRRYSQSFRSHKLTDYARRTISNILGKMVRARYLEEGDLAAERARPLSFEQGEAVPLPAADVDGEPPMDQPEESEVPAEEAPAAVGI